MPEPDKHELITLFEYARPRIIKSMELRHCPHSGFYNAVDERCTFCHQGMECLWMNRNDDLVALEQKSVAELRQQLLMAVEFVDASLTPHHLSRRQCQCDNCQWLKQVEKALAKFK
ncbi:hypothetical protein L9G15_11365 [Shewanella sp. A3A]|uniref:Uncharacterized protein n=1 Tax=Shewanella electrica TaxID=515560 RepID=A0ABT2FNZ1_9GAMM|nr:hypothetical protein [Shewanella electrica]MCH1920031.1 hypothetical protein [Shewanella ferrihydritica]MCH1925692.1 hypothetical protein [Shewanella electrica]MCS4558059.1 hypothetical protein [Shewanella electrica]